MKVLVATSKTQGAAPGDYCWTVEGELVRVLADECRSAGRCGCARGFPGLASSRATTTAEIVERDISLDDLSNALRDSLDREGWLEGLDPTERAAEIAEHLSAVTCAAATFEVGAIVRRLHTLVFDGLPRSI